MPSKLGLANTASGAGRVHPAVVARVSLDALGDFGHEEATGTSAVWVIKATQASTHSLRNQMDKEVSFGGVRSEVVDAT